MREFKGCSKCREFGGYYLYQLDNGEEVLRKCRCLQIFQDEVLLEYKIEKSGLSLKIFNYKISSYIGEDENKNLPKIKKYVKEFREKFHNKHLYIYGSYGTQKTTIAQWMGRELLKAGFTVQYTVMNDLIRDLINDSDFERRNETNLSKYNTDLLIIDESFDKRKVLWYKSNYQMSFIDTYIRNRLETENKATVFVSNIAPDGIGKSFDEGFEDLIQRNTEEGQLLFTDHYSKKDTFDPLSIWD